MGEKIGGVWSLGWYAGLERRLGCFYTTGYRCYEHIDDAYFDVQRTIRRPSQVRGRADCLVLQGVSGQALMEANSSPSLLICNHLIRSADGFSVHCNLLTASRVD